MQLNPEQQRAITAMLAHAHRQTAEVGFTLAGPAGSGKTTVLAQLIRELIQAPIPMRVLVTGFTHSAVAVLADKVGGDGLPTALFRCCTLASAMGWHLSDKEDGSKALVMTTSEKAPIFDYDLLVVDEASMIPDPQTVAALTLAEDHGLRVIFTGDMPQMKPVTGSKHAEALSLRQRQRADLRTIMRQLPDNDLTSMLALMRLMSTQNLRLLPGDLLRMPMRHDGTLHLQRGALRAAVDLSVGYTRAGESSVVVGYRNEFMQDVNMAVFQALYPGVDTPFGIGETVIFHGEHDTVHGSVVRNGTRGRVVAIRPGQHRVPAFAGEPCFLIELEMINAGYLQSATVLVHADPAYWERCIDSAWDDYRMARRRHDRKMRPILSERAKATEAAFAPMRHAWASTVYKAQGSTLDHSVVLLDDLQVMPKGEQALYVATSRASESATVLSMKF